MLAIWTRGFYRTKCLAVSDPVLSTQTILSLNSLLEEEKRKGGNQTIGKEKRGKEEKEKGGGHKIGKVGKGEKGKRKKGNC